MAVVSVIILSGCLPASLCNNRVCLNGLVLDWTPDKLVIVVVLQLNVGLFFLVGALLVHGGVKRASLAETLVFQQYVGDIGACC